MSWMSIPAKKAKTPRKKQKHNNPNNTKCQNVSPVLYLACQGGGLPPRQLRHWRQARNNRLRLNQIFA